MYQTTLLFKVQLGLLGGSNPPVSAEGTGSIPDPEDLKARSNEVVPTAAAPELRALDREAPQREAGAPNFSDPTHCHHKESSAATDPAQP